MGKIVLFSILKRQKYFWIAIITAVLMFGLSYYLTVYNITGKSMAAYAMMSGLGFTILSLLLSLAVSVLFGFYLALFFLRRDIVKKREERNKIDKFASGGGLASGLLAAGCPTCGAPLLALFGAPLALFSLPFRGLELKVLSIVFLIWAIYMLMENVKKILSCELKSS